MQQTKSLLHRLFVPILASIIFMLQGCSGRPWTNQVDETKSKSVTVVYKQMQERDSMLPCFLETDIVISWDTPIAKQAIGGYLQLVDPFNVKYVVSNPLGQPHYMVVTDGKSFQSINTSQRKFMSGTLDSLLRHYNVPTSMFFANWGANLTGRLQQESWVIEKIRHDRENRGIWFTVRYMSGNKKRKNHLLVNLAEKKLLTRVIVDEQLSFERIEGEGAENIGREQMVDNTIATIHYGDWINEKGCLLPTRLIIQGFAFNSELIIQLDNIATSPREKPENFKIKSPPGYLHQSLP